MGDYQEILEIITVDTVQAFRSCKALLADINALAKPQKQQEETILTRSLLELQFSVLRLALSLASDLGEHQFVIDCCLRVQIKIHHDLICIGS